MYNEADNSKERVTPAPVPGRGRRVQKLVARAAAREGLSQLAEQLLDEERLQSLPEWVTWVLEFLAGW